MSTRVPEGTSERTVEDVRRREAAHSRELADRGHLLRLWRPPLQPGEWRTLGLFSATDDEQLEEVLASMPLRIWRTDAVTPLSPHPNDPPAVSQRTVGRLPDQPAVEFLITLMVDVPSGTPEPTVDDAKAREASRAHDLAEQGHLLRHWTPPAAPGDWRILGLWRAQDATEMQTILESLPLYAWTLVETTPLGRHPSDPATIKTG